MVRQEEAWVSNISSVCRSESFSCLRRAKIMLSFVILYLFVQTHRLSNNTIKQRRTHAPICFSGEHKGLRRSFHIFSQDKVGENPGRKYFAVRCANR